MRAAHAAERQRSEVARAARGAERQNQRDETDRRADADEAGAQPGERDFRFRIVVLHRFVLLKGVHRHKEESDDARDGEQDVTTERYLYNVTCPGDGW